MKIAMNMTERAARAEALNESLASALADLRAACGRVVLSTLPSSYDVLRLTTASNRASIALESWEQHRADLETLALNAQPEEVK